MKKDEFLELRKDAAIEGVLNTDNVRIKTLEYPRYQQKYSYLLVNERRVLNDINSKREKIYGKLYHEYKFGTKDFQFSLTNKSEIDIYIRCNDKYIEIQDKYDEQLIIVKFLEDHLTILKNTGFGIGHYIELEKLRQGVL